MYDDSTTTGNFFGRHIAFDLLIFAELPIFLN